MHDTITIHYQLAPGQESGTIPLNLTHAPRDAAIVDVRIPIGADPEQALHGSVRGQLRTDGIDFVLSAAPTQPGYVLTCIVWL